MDSKRIEELLNKYWECNTSLEEEQQLRDYFQGSDIPEQHKETAALFRYFNANKKTLLNDSTVEEHVLQHVRGKRPGKAMNLFYNAMRMAAGIAVLMIAIWFVRTEIRESSTEGVVDTYDDPQLAFEETKKALLMISKSFGQAEQEVKKITLFNEAQKEIQNKSDKRKVKL